MGISLQWLGHGGWRIQTGSHRILLDPFVTGNPSATMRAEDLEADYILVSHGHEDHIADVPEVARRTKATVIAIFEIAQWLGQKHRIERTVGMNLGGAVQVPFGRVQMTPAWHSSVLPDGTPGGSPAGFVLSIADRRLYFACDTALFSEMQRIGQPRLDVAVLPIGDLFTMGPEDSLEAIQLLQPTFVLPAHYNTWPPIQQDAAAWAARVRQVTTAKPVVLAPGETFEL